MLEINIVLLLAINSYTQDDSNLLNQSSLSYESKLHEEEYIKRIPDLFNILGLEDNNEFAQFDLKVQNLLKLLKITK